MAELTAAQQAAVNYKLAHPAASYKKIAEHIGVSAGTISNWKINDLVADALAADSEVVLGMVKDSLPDAVRVLIEQLKSDDERVAQAAAKLLLEHGLGKPKVTTFTDVTSDGESLIVTGMDVSRLMKPVDPSAIQG